MQQTAHFATAHDLVDVGKVRKLQHVLCLTHFDLHLIETAFDFRRVLLPCGGLPVRLPLGVSSSGSVGVAGRPVGRCPLTPQ